MHQYTTNPVGVAGANVLATVQNCEVTCEHMTSCLLTTADVCARENQIKLLHDCADICGVTAKVIARNSYLAKSFASFCAQICEMCAAECARFPDPESQRCAQMCMQCARECRAFAAS